MSSTSSTTAEQLTISRRAQPLSVDERQSMIIDAVIPLLIEHGRAVTSKQIAEAAGIAEGTVFRAFGDKDSLIAAAVARYVDPEPLREKLRSISAGLPLEVKVESVVQLMRERFGSIFQMMAVVGRSERPRADAGRAEFDEIVRSLLAPELAELNWPPELIARIFRMVTFASTFPPLNDGTAFDDEELARIILYGVVGKPSGAAPTAASPSDAAPTTTSPTAASSH